jgi:hypothetical protein
VRARRFVFVLAGCASALALAGAPKKKGKPKPAPVSAGSLISKALDDDAAAKARPCIDGVLQATAFPKHDGPLASADREWTFSTVAR